MGGGGVVEFLSRLLGEIRSLNLGTIGACMLGAIRCGGVNTKFGSVRVWKDDSWSDKGGIRSTIRRSECRSVR